MNPHASQANNASKADQDSPFALLMAASAPKEDEPARAQEDTQRPANDQAAAQPAKPQARPESKSESKSESKPKAKSDEKTKPDEKAVAENDGQDQKEEVAVANDNAAPTPTPETKAGTTHPVPPPVAPLIVIADAMAPETPSQESTAPVAAATQPVQDLAALTAAQAATNGAVPQTRPATATPTETQAAPQPQTQQAAAPQASQTPTQQPPAEQISLPQASVSGTPHETPDLQPDAPQPVVQPVAAQQTDAAQSVQAAPAPTTAKETLVQVATLQNPSAAKPAETGEQTDAAAPANTGLKTDAAKPVTHELPAQHAENKDVKSDVPRPEIVKTDAAKPDTAQPAMVETTAPKAAPQVQTPPSTNIAATHANATLQPQATMPGALPGMPQHVQVSAQTSQPNMPALAVEIAAKSQSGAKQFDIRLDPPELGRVEVRLSIDAAGKASAHLSADQPQTLELLQKDSSSLTRALREAGLNVSQDGLNFSLRQQNHDGNSAQQGQNQGRNASRGVNLIATNTIEATQTSASYRGDGRLDIRV